MLTEIVMLKLINVFKLKCRGIDNGVLSYNSEEVELKFEDKVDSENEISVGKDVNDKIYVRVE